MSVQAIAWAKAIRTGSPTLKAVLVAIADYADPQGYGWPKQEVIAEDTEFSLRAVRNAFGALEDAGLLTRTPRWREDGTRRSDGVQLSMRPADNRHEVPHDRHEVPVMSKQPAPRAGGSTGTSCRINRHEVPDSLRSNHQQNHQKKRLADAGADTRAPAREALPAEWPLTELRRQRALTEGIPADLVEEQHRAFVDTVRDEGGRSADWDSRWGKWCAAYRRLPSAQQARAGPNRFNPHKNPYLRVLWDETHGEPADQHQPEAASLPARAASRQ